MAERYVNAIKYSMFGTTLQFIVPGIKFVALREIMKTIEKFRCFITFFHGP